MRSLLAAVDALLGSGAGNGAGAAVSDPHDVSALVAGASVEQLGDWLSQLQRCVDVLGGLHAQLGAVFDAAGGPAQAGCSSLGVWSRRELRLSGAEIRARAHAGRALTSLERVRVAARAGLIRPEHVVEFGRGCDKVGAPIMAQAQDALLPVATGCEPGVLRQAIDHLHATVHPDDPDAGWVKAQHKQDLSCTRVGHGYQVRGFLDADTGAMLAALLATWTRTHSSSPSESTGNRTSDRAADQGADRSGGGGGGEGFGGGSGEAGADEGLAAEACAPAGSGDSAVAATIAGTNASPDTGAAGEPAALSGSADTGAGTSGREVDDRPVARRRVEGLKTLLSAVLDAGLPSDKGIRPHLNVTVDLATLVRAVRGDRASASPPPTLSGYGVTGRDLIARLACDASLGVILTDGTTDQHRCTHHAGSTPDATETGGSSRGGAGPRGTTPGGAAAMGARGSVLHRCGCPVTPYVHVLDVGRAERLATPKQRLAVLAAQQHRCATPGCVNTHLEVHHLVSWLDHGPTNMDNLIGLCSSCHTLLHRGLLRCAADGHGTVVFTRSDGSVITDVRRHALAAYAAASGDLVSASLLTVLQQRRMSTPPPRRRPPRQHARPSRTPARDQPEQPGHPEHGHPEQGHPEHGHTEHGHTEHGHTEHRGRWGDSAAAPPF